MKITFDISLQWISGHNNKTWIINFELIKKKEKQSCVKMPKNEIYIMSKSQRILNNCLQKKVVPKFLFLYHNKSTKLPNINVYSIVIRIKILIFLGIRK